MCIGAGESFMSLFLTIEEQPRIWQFVLDFDSWSGFRILRGIDLRVREGMRFICILEFRVKLFAEVPEYFYFYMVGGHVNIWNLKFLKFSVC